MLHEHPTRGDHDHDDDYEECQQDTGSPCTTGGLHMPNSKSMLDFARQVKSRLRFYSQCHQDSYIGMNLCCMLILIFRIWKKLLFVIMLILRKCHMFLIRNQYCIIISD